jgi:aspartate-semialdehyde dehydrogenase
MTISSKSIDVGVLGATGTVGQQLIALLDGHPWFNLTWLAASHRSERRRYADATKWRLPTSRPEQVADMIVNACAPPGAPKLIFSGLDASVAGDVEATFAEAGHTIISNANNHRMEADVPLLVPEINRNHLELLTQQTTQRGWSGRIVTNPNCSTIILTMALAPLLSLGLRAVNVTTLQAISGAGYPGLASLDIVGNVIPFISGEEEKIESETKKVFGSLKDGSVEPHGVAISAHTARVPVINGHTMMISVGLNCPASIDDLLGNFREFSGPPKVTTLPTAPKNPVIYLDQPDRPQPRLDVDRDRGMTVTVGRLRPCPLLDFKFVALGHNTIRGAAGAAVLNAELMCADGLF